MSRGVGLSDAVGEEGLKFNGSAECDVGRLDTNGGRPGTFNGATGAAENKAGLAMTFAQLCGTGGVSQFMHSFKCICLCMHDVRLDVSRLCSLGVGGGLGGGGLGDGGGGFGGGGGGGNGEGGESKIGNDDCGGVLPGASVMFRDFST